MVIAPPQMSPSAKPHGCALAKAIQVTKPQMSRSATTSETRTREASGSGCGCGGDAAEARGLPFGPRSNVAIPGEMSVVFGTAAGAGAPGVVLAPCINVPRLRPSAGLGVLPI